MKWLTRFIPAFVALLVLVVGSMVVVSHAQTNDLASSAETNSGNSPAAVLVTKDSFDTAANSICLTMANQLTANSDAFQQQVKEASQGQPANQLQPATTPLFGTTTTQATGTGSQSALAGGGGSSSTTAPAAPSGSYDKSEVQANPLAIVNQLLGEYMDQMDAIVGMQNDVLDELEGLSEPPADAMTLQQTWVSMTQAMIAQNQADVILENILADYYTAGFEAASSTLNGTPLSVSSAETNNFSQNVFNQDLFELTGTSNGGNAQPGSLEANLEAIAGPVDAALGAYGLNQCEIAGIEFQNYQTLASSIPNIANDYLTTYNSQANAKSAISLAQILNSLPTPVGENLLFSGG